MKTSYTGFGENVITIEADPALTQTGIPVKITTDGKAAPCAADDVFCGVCVNICGDYAGVALKGYVSLPLSGSCTPGYQKLCAAAGGAVKSGESGREYLVLESASGRIGFIL